MGGSYRSRWFALARRGRTGWAERRLFLGVAGLGVVADHAHNMSLMVVLIKRVAHRFAVDGQGGVLLSERLIVALESLIEISRVDANHDIANDEFARDDVVGIDTPAAKSLAGFRRETLSPVGHGLVAAHATEGGATNNGQDARQRVASSLGAAWIGDVGKEIWQREHLLSV